MAAIAFSHLQAELPDQTQADRRGLLGERDSANHGAGNGAYHNSRNQEQEYR